MPRAILVKINSYKGLTYFNTNYILIEPIIYRFKYKNTNYTRRNFLPVLAYTITIYKSQGLTLKRVILSFKYPDYTIGLLYIAVSRVKKLYNIIIEYLFDITRFRIKKSNNI